MDSTATGRDGESEGDAARHGGLPDGSHGSSSRSTEGTTDTIVSGVSIVFSSSPAGSNGTTSEKEHEDVPTRVGFGSPREGKRTVEGGEEAIGGERGRAWKKGGEGGALVVRNEVEGIQPVLTSSFISVFSGRGGTGGTSPLSPVLFRFIASVEVGSREDNMGGADCVALLPAASH